MTGETAISGAESRDHHGTASGGAWREFWATPWQVRLYLVAVTVAAVALAFAVGGRAGREQDPAAAPAWVTVLVLVLVSVLNVEIGRAMAGGLERSHQPHKALSAWAFASALLLPAPWLLVVVPATYAHTRWRGLRLPLWKWCGSAVFLVLSGTAAFAVRQLLFGDFGNWMNGDGGRGVIAMAAAAATFLATETLLFSGSALLNDATDEVWLRRTLRSPAFYGTEAAVVLTGGLFAAVWTGGPWFVLLFPPIYVLVQRAALLEPVRERAAVAAVLAAKNRELELANQFKADLMGMLGHEIGNPLTSALGYAQIGSEVLARGDTDTARTAFAVLQRNTAEIRRVVNEILNLVSSDHGALTAHPERCLLETHLRAAVAAQRPEHQPTVQCPTGLTAFVQPGHLDQILANLLSNAAKYAGGAARLSARSDGNGGVELAVADDGPGIPPGFHDVLFDRFSRSPETAHAVTGSGLGLYITRQLAQANGGDVALAESSGHGCTFVVRLPAGT